MMSLPRRLLGPEGCCKEKVVGDGVKALQYFLEGRCLWSLDVVCLHVIPHSDTGRFGGPF
jgi:hypothetical protein